MDKWQIDLIKKDPSKFDIIVARFPSNPEQPYHYLAMHAERIQPGDFIVVETPQSWQIVMVSDVIKPQDLPALPSFNLKPISGKLNVELTNIGKALVDHCKTREMGGLNYGG